MDMSYIDGLIMPIITVACMCIGYIMKKWLPQDDKWIPTTLLIIGAISGVLLFGLSYEGVVKGMVSGLAAVGLHQAFKQHLKLGMDETELYAMGSGLDSDEAIAYDLYQAYEIDEEEGVEQDVTE